MAVSARGLACDSVNDLPTSDCGVASSIRFAISRLNRHSLAESLLKKAPVGQRLKGPFAFGRHRHATRQRSF